MKIGKGKSKRAAARKRRGVMTHREAIGRAEIARRRDLFRRAQRGDRAAQEQIRAEGLRQ